MDSTRGHNAVVDGQSSCTATNLISQKLLNSDQSEGQQAGKAVPFRDSAGCGVALTTGGLGRCGMALERP